MLGCFSFGRRTVCLRRLDRARRTNAARVGGWNGPSIQSGRCYGRQSRAWAPYPRDILLLVALTRLECQVVGYVSSEVDKECKHLIRRRWPEVIELGDVAKVDGACVALLHQAFGRDLNLVLVGAGSPCQDLSSLQSNCQGLAGARSKLFFEIPRIIRLPKVEFHTPVHYFVENVFSMDEPNRREFSRVLGRQPLLIDAKWFSWCHRPRLWWWCSWFSVMQAGACYRMETSRNGFFPCRAAMLIRGWNQTATGTEQTPNGYSP